MNTQYLFVGGAYGDMIYKSSKEPDTDQFEVWEAGELLIFKIDSDGKLYQPLNAKGEWEEILDYESQTPKGLGY